MTTVAEGLVAKSELASDLAAGTNAISSNQKITFTKYVKLVLPLDGYVFWVKATLVSPSALLNSMLLNASALNETPTLGATTVGIKPGSLHYATNAIQGAEASYSINRVTLSSLVPINDLDAVGPNVLYIGEFDGERFAFSQRKNFYKQADLYHYVGDAVYPIMENQLIDDLVSLQARTLIVSNSLPIWLAMNGADPSPTGYPIGEFSIGISSIGGTDGKVPLGYVAPPFNVLRGAAGTLYPAYLVPVNEPPPFAAVNVLEGTTEGLQAGPRFGKTLSRSSWVKEKVRVTLWGTDNLQALDFIDFVGQFTLDTELMGLMNIPVVRDEKMTQVEFGTIAQKKTIEFEVNYFQQAARDVARMLILSAIPTFYIDGKKAA